MIKDMPLEEIRTARSPAGTPPVAGRAYRANVAYHPLLRSDYVVTV